MDGRIGLPESHAYEYMTAQLDVGREKLGVLHLGRDVRSLPFRIDGLTMSCWQINPPGP
jgi:hypothetical protein